MLEKYPHINGITIEALKKMDAFELERLSTEIRAFLIKELSNVGGHVASNLGVVELTIALFRVFDSPTDAFFWDIGHQAYVHKILTGRAERFSTLRQYEGLSGFIKKSESVHDIWEAGHASTSLSGATGMSIDRDLHREKFHVISIIGDGALTGGMALEALNHIGDLGRPHIIILNDNNMSISGNVGGLNKHINGLRVNPNYVKAKRTTKYVLSKIKTPGKVIKEGISWVKSKMKSLLLQGTDNTFFNTMGLDYIGPIDGHDLEQLEAALEHAKLREKPVVLHVLTTKGKGYNPAETDEKGSWHGIGPYSYEEGVKLRKKDTKTLRQWSSVVSETLERFAQQDTSIVAVTPAMIKGSKLVHFAQKYPERIFDVGIAEEHAMTVIGGMAVKKRLKPFLAIYSTFIQRAYDQLLHDLDRQKLPVVIGIDRCGFAGGDGETHHGIYDISILRSIPHMVITMGKDATETQHLLYNAFYQYQLQGPLAIRYPRGYTKLPYVFDFEEIPFGSWEYLQENKKAKTVILTFGPQLVTAEKVAQELAGEYEIDIVNARFIKPMDTKMLAEIAKKYRDIITIEEGAKQGGFGTGVLTYLHEQGHYKPHVHIFGIDDTYIEQGDSAKLLQLAGLDVESIVAKLRERLK